MNQPNFQVTDANSDKKYWISRSCAVCVIPIFVKSFTDFYVPLGKRSSDMPQEPNKYGLVCGYLDWGETLQEAALRETREELGLNLEILGGLPEQPNFVCSDPQEDALQNITHRFIAKYFVSSLPTLYCGPEVSNTKWLSNMDLLCLEETLAFNHFEIIKWAFQRMGSLPYQNV